MIGVFETEDSIVIARDGEQIFSMKLDAEERQEAIGRIRAQLSAAGYTITPTEE